MSAPAPARRRDLGRRRALALLVATGLALVGVVTLLVVYVGLAARAMGASVDAEQPCLVAAQDGGTARVRHELLPPRAVCTWQADGEPREVVLASAPTPLVVGAGTLAVAGVLATAVVLVPRGARPNG
ncbi:hypothetical protein [Cellulomonas sp.]|uniref:hypothetical protein n=1 Tax=Cellulomonas sp. TaxID=40001 RepID=UPI0028110C47|nr:hypothetical protein [Cellulomonas sp.]